jgi:hypothetical protein
VILLGLAAARRLMGLSTNGLTITLATVALVWGALDLSRSVWHLPLELGGEFAILMVVFGLTLLAVGLVKGRSPSTAGAG